MPYKVVAEGTNIWNLESTVGELELPKGSRVKVMMDLKFPLGWAFDVAGAELIFKPFVPDGMTLIDVYGEDSLGIVEMEADPAWLVAILAFIKLHWLAITITGLLLTAIIASIIVLVKIAVAPAFPTAAVAIGGGLALVGILAALSMKRR
ncbi:hypothetical protein ES703_102228 [subsurface metagenome]